MAQNKNAPMCMHLLIISLTLMLIQFPDISSAARYQKNFGVCYSTQLNNLAPFSKPLGQFYSKYNVTLIRLYDPNPTILRALANTGIRVVLGVPKQDVPSIASSLDAAISWVKTNVHPYVNDFVMIKYIVIGNELIPGPLASQVAPAMQNMWSALVSDGLLDIKVTTVVGMNVLQHSYPPSGSEFVAEAKDSMKAVLDFLVKKQLGRVLMANVYPYVVYAANPSQISLDFALGNSTQPVLHDADLSYYTLFDAMVDAFHWAKEKLLAGNVALDVSESGWPYEGNGNLATPENQVVYNRNFFRHITRGVGTPKRPGIRFDGFIFNMYDENLKPPGVEQRWGLIELCPDNPKPIKCSYDYLFADTFPWRNFTIPPEKV